MNENNFTIDNTEEAKNLSPVCDGSAGGDNVATPFTLPEGWEGDEPVYIENIVLDASQLTLLVGQMAFITASITPEDIDLSRITWNSSNPAVASVNENGTVFAKSSGYAEIYATSIPKK